MGIRMAAQDQTPEQAELLFNHQEALGFSGGDFMIAPRSLAGAHQGPVRELEVFGGKLHVTVDWMAEAIGDMANRMWDRRGMQAFNGHTYVVNLRGATRVRGGVNSDMIDFVTADGKARCRLYKADHDLRVTDDKLAGPRMDKELQRRRVSPLLAQNAEEMLDANLELNQGGCYRLAVKGSEGFLDEIAGYLRSKGYLLSHHGKIEHALPPTPEQESDICAGYVMIVDTTGDWDNHSMNKLFKTRHPRVSDSQVAVLLSYSSSSDDRIGGGAEIDTTLIEVGY